MNRPDIERPPAAAGEVASPGLRQLADQAFQRAAGARLIPGNGVRVLKDAAENFPAWLDAIRGAERTVYFESYIVGDDPVGREFVDALAERARAGVRVRLLYDWLGTRASRSLFVPLVEAGGEVRVFNPPRFDSPVGWLTRDHRKSIAVDGRIGFVSGLCASAQWLGDPARRIDAWRDTGVEIRGPAVAEIERAFAQVWAACGGSMIDEVEYTPAESIIPAGDVALRVVATVPDSGGLFRLDHLIAAAAGSRLWLTDAYFVGLMPYVQALCSAARDDVDVRLLVPGASDVPVVSRISRAGYRQLLENGVRVFEWNGSMLHAKSAVADDRWARVGSTNLNIASWLTNYELDVAIEDERLVAGLARMYEQDLANATEIVLGRRYRVRALPLEAGPNARRAFSGSAGRAAAGAVSVGAVVRAALTSRRILGPAEASLLGIAAAILIVFAAIAVMWPEVLAYPIALIATWAGAVMLMRARRLWRERRRRQAASS
ncbi:MAG TPA: phospholipase D-like domain-containing protein [Burkholderiales bacterium]|nr:phospholipase D-like domain-containing protein [Burkholderiales bacterium]